MYVRVVWGWDGQRLWALAGSLLSRFRSFGGHRGLFAADMNSLFDNFVHAARVNIVTCRNPILKLAIPMPKPDLDGIVKSEFAARQIVVIHRKVSIG
jgi:hypothetical protein